MKIYLAAEHSSELSCLAFARVVQLIYVSAMNIFHVGVWTECKYKTTHLQSTLSYDGSALEFAKRKIRSPYSATIRPYFMKTQPENTR